MQATTSPATTDGAVQLDGVGAFLAGTANVIMQLALAPVGYGVLESPVESGRIDRHPIKRFRTTFTYISVAMMGTDDERARYREAVDRSHRQVRSTAESPVRYNAFSRDLQLWVAACLYWGSVDIHEKLHGPIPEDVAEQFYRECARFGTTLQVPPELWPADRAAFARYWAEGLERVSIDEPVRRYLTSLMTREHMPRVLRGNVRFTSWVTTGFLPPPFRKQMRLSWTERDEVRFRRLMRAIGRTQQVLPGAVRRFPFNALLWDLRRRVRTGRPLV